MLEILTAQHGQAVSEAAMGSSELSHSVFSLAPFLLLLAALAEVAGGELAMFIVHVQPQEGQVLASADDRKSGTTGCSCPRTAGSSTRTTTSPAASQPG